LQINVLAHVNINEQNCHRSVIKFIIQSSALAVFPEQKSSKKCLLVQFCSQLLAVKKLAVLKRPLPLLALDGTRDVIHKYKLFFNEILRLRGNHRSAIYITLRWQKLFYKEAFNGRIIEYIMDHHCIQF